MARLHYAAICSLDGYTEDADGKFDWAAPDQEVHAFVNDLERAIGTALYGRRMYETLAVWQTIGGPEHDADGERLRRGLAGDGQGRLLDHADGGQHATHPAGAQSSTRRRCAG